jgi:hypothetical protein
MATKLTQFRLTAEDKAHIKTIRENVEEVETDTDAVRLALKKYAEAVEKARAKKQEQLQEL